MPAGVPEGPEAAARSEVSGSHRGLPHLHCLRQYRPGRGTRSVPDRGRGAPAADEHLPERRPFGRVRRHAGYPVPAPHLPDAALPTERQLLAPGLRALADGADGRGRTMDGQRAGGAAVPAHPATGVPQVCLRRRSLLLQPEPAGGGHRVLQESPGASQRTPQRGGRRVRGLHAGHALQADRAGERGHPPVHAQHRQMPGAQGYPELHQHLPVDGRPLPLLGPAEVCPALRHLRHPGPRALLGHRSDDKGPVVLPERTVVREPSRLCPSLLPAG